LINKKIVILTILSVFGKNSKAIYLKTSFPAFTDLRIPAVTRVNNS
jgi:hypothetical protein